MGIRMLNKFLQNKCSSAIKHITLEELSGKSIAVDTSIYMYKYIGENALLENFYLMISFFRKYNIKPIFIFDGKPPVEKNETIEQRKKIKKNAKEEYNRLNILLKESQFDDTTNLTQQDKMEIESTMEKLKKQFIMISHDNIQNVKSLFQAYGVTYFEAPGEADILCAKFVLKHKVYACLSEDMDMFVYGCPRVLRYLSLTTESVIMYDLNEILTILDVKIEEFKQICILSGTDYSVCTKKSRLICENIKEEGNIEICDCCGNIINKNNTENKKKSSTNNDITIFNSYKLLKKYKDYVNEKNQYIDISNNIVKGKKKINKKTNNICDFYSWLEIENIIKLDIISLYYISTMFDLSTFKYLKNYDKILIMNGPISKDMLIDVMKKENFIFL